MSCLAITTPTSLCLSASWCMPSWHGWASTWPRWLLMPFICLHVWRLGFLALITGLCQSYEVPITPSKVIRLPITRAFIKKYSTPRQVQGDAHQAADTPPPPQQADPAGSLGVERYLQHLVRQQAANHRGQVQIHECVYEFSLSQ